MKRFPSRAAGIVCVVLLPIVLLLSCSGSAPSLDEWKWRILYRDDGGDRREELYAVFRGSDPDGDGDFASLAVIIESADLEWIFDRGEWTKIPGEDGGLWALPPMISQEGARLPDGLYTVRLSDLAGRQAETSFRPRPDRPDPDDLEWPEADLEDGRLSLSGPFAEGELLLRGVEMELLERIPVADGSVPDFGEALWWELWFGYEAEREDSRVGGERSGAEPRGFRLGPYPVNPSGTVPDGA